jgi:hypothetical protein
MLAFARIGLRVAPRDLEKALGTAKYAKYENVAQIPGLTKMVSAL